MTNALQTNLIGMRVELKVRGDGQTSWYDPRDSARGDLSGVIRTVAVGDDGVIVFQIEDNDGWIHTRSTTSHVFKVDHVKTSIDKLQALTQEFDGYPEFDPYYRGAATVLGREPTKDERDRFKLALYRAIYNLDANRVRYKKPARELGDLKIGDRFRFVSPPAGWTDQKLLIVKKRPGWAAPEGWDYLVWPPPDSIHQELVELLEESAPVTGGPFVPEED